MGKTLVVFWVVAGEANTRKTSAIRALSGAGRRQKEWDLEVGGQPTKAYIEMTSPQELPQPLSPQDIVARVSARPLVTHLLISLRHRGRKGTPDAIAYVQHFLNFSWQCKGILITSPEVAGSPLATSYRSLVDYAPALIRPFAPSNAIANVVRGKWDL